MNTQYPVKRTKPGKNTELRTQNIKPKTHHMKHLLATIVVAIAFAASGKAQCLTHVKYSASRMQILDSSLTQQGEKEEPFTITTRSDGFTGIRENEVEDSLHGVLKSIDCSGWKEPFKNGTITMVCDVEGQQETMNATITIEAIEGKLTITIRAKDRPDRILRLAVDKYEELK